MNTKVTKHKIDVVNRVVDYNNNMLKKHKGNGFIVSPFFFTICLCVNQVTDTIWLPAYAEVRAASARAVGQNTVYVGTPYGYWFQRAKLK